MRYVIAVFNKYGMCRQSCDAERELVGYKVSGSRPTKDFKLATKFSIEEARKVAKNDSFTCVYEILEDMDGELYLSQVGQGIL